MLVRRLLQRGNHAEEKCSECGEHGPDIGVVGLTDAVLVKFQLSGDIDEGFERARCGDTLK